LAKKFRGLIDEYNAGSQNIEAFFEELKKFARNLTAEEQRSIAEGLTEEELALFDIPVFSRHDAVADGRLRCFRVSAKALPNSGITFGCRASVRSSLL